MPRKPSAKKSPSKIQIRSVTLEELEPDERAAVEAAMADAARPADVPVIKGRRKGFKVLATPEAMAGLAGMPPELMKMMVDAITDHAAAEKRRKNTKPKIRAPKPRLGPPGMFPGSVPRARR